MLVDPTIETLDRTLFHILNLIQDVFLKFFFIEQLNNIFSAYLSSANNAGHVLQLILSNMSNILLSNILNNV